MAADATSSRRANIDGCELTDGIESASTALVHGGVGEIHSAPSFQPDADSDSAGATGRPRPPEEILRAELSNLRVGELRVRAARGGVDVSVIDEARDSIDPKVAMVELVVAAECAAPPVRTEREGCASNGQPLPCVSHQPSGRDTPAAGRCSTADGCAGGQAAASHAVAAAAAGTAEGAATAAARGERAPAGTAEASGRPTAWNSILTAAAGFDEGLLALSVPIIVYKENPYMDKKLQ
jgi:hypothetical protein